MTDRVYVAEESELQPGERKIVDVDGLSIGVFNIEGEYYAIENRCVHQGGPVSTGKKQGRVAAEFPGPGERVKEEFDDENPVVACPWHGFEYEIKTGNHVGDPSYSLPTYDVVIESGDVYLEI